MTTRNMSLQSQDLVLSRRAIVAGLTTAGLMAVPRINRADEPAATAPPGALKQSLVNWCYAKYWPLPDMCEIANQLGCRSVELVQPDHWPVLKTYGLTCALAPCHSFVQGMCHEQYRAGCVHALRQRIDQCAEAEVPAVITFTGFAQETGAWAAGRMPSQEQINQQHSRVVDSDVGMANCVKGFKQVARYAERQGVNVSLEMLNSRVPESMKGHPGYLGDHIDYCGEIVRKVGSPRFGLLFDVYHVQIMDGDLIRRIRGLAEIINHVHTAGNPGRGELDQHQEINYPAVMRTLKDVGYRGYIGQEFIPVGDPLAGLKQAVDACNV